jgi:hypothetical protein
MTHACCYPSLPRLCRGISFLTYFQDSTNYTNAYLHRQLETANERTNYQEVMRWVSPASGVGIAIVPCPLHLCLPAGLLWGLPGCGGLASHCACPQDCLGGLPCLVIAMRPGVSARNACMPSVCAAGHGTTNTPTSQLPWRCDRSLPQPCTSCGCHGRQTPHSCAWAGVHFVRPPPGGV